ncbi:MAG: hypothetical protein H8D22_10175 [Candidatus Cloacimonetes bacterium]|nr:hypothetical protein [Candidatus Cloacimonadota bacterium]
MVGLLLVAGFILFVFIGLFLRGLTNFKNERINNAREKCKDCKYCIFLYNSGFTYCRNLNNEFYMSSTMVDACEWKERRE